MTELKVLVVGCGNMGRSHALAYKKMKDCRVVGAVSRTPTSRNALAGDFGGIETFADYRDALRVTRPDAVLVSTYPDTHARIAMDALAQGAHVFVEKPLAVTVKEAARVVRSAKKAGKKLVVGYILQHHPAWAEFVRLSRTLGKPLVMRMNLNQQSSGSSWVGHRNLMQSASPIVDCGVHYVEVMCRMTGSTAVRVHAIGARLTDAIAPDMYNYGQLQIRFRDGSVGWYEAGWGPMMSETAYFVKDVIGPGGSVSIVSPAGRSDDIETHTKSNQIRLHDSRLDEADRFRAPDRLIDLEDEPDHNELCEREQRFFVRAIREDLDVTAHLDGAVDSLRIVLAADKSYRTGRAVSL